LKCLVACVFHGAVIFAFNITVTRGTFSEMARREILHIHCGTHVLSLALTSLKTKYPAIKCVLHATRTIYNIFHISSKRERILHDEQSILEQPLLKIPEITEVSLAEQSAVNHAVKLCSGGIIMTFEHIHKIPTNLV
jgi:hypothetical protein